MNKSNDISLTEIGESFQYLNDFQIAAQPSQTGMRKVESPSSSPVLVRASRFSAAPNLWSIDILLEPIIQRFRFHFRGTQKTNDLSHPEWYYSFVLDSIQKHQSFLEMLQRTFEDSESENYDTISLFISGFCSEIVDKLSEDLETIESNQEIFWQTLNETLTFKKELQQRYDYSNDYPHPLRLFCSNYMDFWIDLETKRT